MTPRRLIVLIAIAAFTLRVVRWPTPSISIAGGAEYFDPQVMYGAAARLLGGSLPYRDFIYLHPPGSILGFLPFAWIGQIIGDAEGLALAQVGMAAIGTLNTVLACLLLSKVGLWAITVGGGLYATSSIFVFTEQLPLLEPPLMTALLLALLWAQRQEGRFHFLAGLALGLATMVKVWAFVDLALVSLLVMSRYGKRGFLAFAAGGATGGLAIGLPFLMAAPSRMWDMVVMAQAGRPSTGGNLLERAVFFGPLRSINDPLSALGIAILLVLIAACLVLIVRSALGVKRRGEEIASHESAWWALLAIAHLAMLAISPTFYDHYAMFAAGPLVLVAGYLAQRASEKLTGRGASWLKVAAVVTVLAAGSASLIGTTIRVADTDVRIATDRFALRSWASQFTCVWASRSDSVLANQDSHAVRNQCPFAIDPYGVTLFQGTHVEGSRAENQWREMSSADAAILRSGDGPFSEDPAQRAEFLAHFESDGRVGDWSLWRRTTQSPTK